MNRLDFFVQVGKLIHRGRVFEFEAAAHMAARFRPMTVVSYRDCAEHAVLGALDSQVARYLQADVMELPAFLPRLEPERPPDSRCPVSARLVGRFMNVAAATEQGLRLLEEPRDGG